MADATRNRSGSPPAPARTYWPSASSVVGLVAPAFELSVDLGQAMPIEGEGVLQQETDGSLGDLHPATRQIEGVSAVEAPLTEDELVAADYDLAHPVWRHWA